MKEATAIGMRRSKVRHRRQGRRTLPKKRLSETQETRPTERLLFLASVGAATVGMRRSKGRHRRQGRRNKEALVGNTGDKTDGTLVVLG